MVLTFVEIEMNKIHANEAITIFIPFSFRDFLFQTTFIKMNVNAQLQTELWLGGGYLLTSNVFSNNIN
jgi:hypothetical protein